LPESQLPGDGDPLASTENPNAANLRETRVSSHELIDGKLLHAFRDYVETPSGDESVREWIDHPGAAAVVPLFADGSTLLVRQFRYPTGRTFLELPAGKRDPGDDPETTAHRELMEETGLSAMKLTPLGPLFPGIGYSSEIIWFFLAEDLTESGTQDLDAGEAVQPVRLPFAEAVARAQRGDLGDMKTVAGLLMADAHLKDRKDRSKQGAADD
jgi:ADP-ribose pyrophosphatase